MLMCPICHASQINDRAAVCWNCKNTLPKQKIPYTNNEILTEIRTLLEKIKILLEKADG